MNVEIWQEKIIIPTYEAGVPDKNPMFFEKRVYQGSSGVVYPHPVIEKIADEKTDKTYTALFIENRYLKIMILPEIGGRVQMAYDKIAGRHFIYYNQVIKPALVGLCGPWISGGIEFNWPQHHRPSTFDPVDHRIEKNADGSKTVWVSEVEKMFRTKGMAGFTLHPDKAYLEIKAQLYNRTNIPQTFLWWANPAVSVDEHYQSVFPPDVNAVFDHGKRDVSTFPIATGTYYKIDYSPGTDISRYKNIPVPTSYMAVNSAYDFVGGYEHDTQAGVLHVADHHVSPGKKQWTWGNGNFGIAWDRNLTDEDGPYIELMTGMFTDNQPDFSWIMPYEEKSFTQYFLPYRELGLVKNASKDLLIGTETDGELLNIKIFATSVQKNLTLRVSIGDEIVSEETLQLSPELVCVRQVKHSGLAEGKHHSVSIRDPNGKELLRYNTEDNGDREVPEAAQPAILPQEAENNELLFLTGQHLEQYRHATYNPVDYYQEALKRDPNDFRCNNAMGLWLLRKGQFEKAVPYLNKAIQTGTKRNPNPYDSEPYYNLGLALRYLGKTRQAYDAFFKSTWSSAWQDTGYFSVAQIDALDGNYDLALEHIDWSLDRNARNGKAYMVKMYALRKLDRIEPAIKLGYSALERDGFNISVLFELFKCYQEIRSDSKAKEILDQIHLLSRGTVNNLIEYAIEFAELGRYKEAIELLHLVDPTERKDPMLNYYSGYYSFLAGDRRSGESFLRTAAKADPAYCFPNRLEDIVVLQFAAKENNEDAKALYYLGNLWYDKRQYVEALAAWKSSADKDLSFATVFRNMAIAEYNKNNDPAKALILFEKAFALNTKDARVLMELDQLHKKLNYPAAERLNFLLSHGQVAEQRDDVYLEIAALENFNGDNEKALSLISARQFHPWEGGEGKVSGQYIYSLVEMARSDIRKGEYAAAIKKLEQAQVYPHNLGEGKLPGAQENDIFYWTGCAQAGLGNKEKAQQAWKQATIGLSEPSAAMFYNDQQPDKIFYQGLAWEQLEQSEHSRLIFENLVNYGLQHQNDEVRIDYFAVSLPDLLIFEDDLQNRNAIHCQYIAGLGYLGLRQFEYADASFRAVLAKDAMHFGAKTHLDLSGYLNGRSIKAISNA